MLLPTILRAILPGEPICFWKLYQSDLITSSDYSRILFLLHELLRNQHEPLRAPRNGGSTHTNWLWFQIVQIRSRRSSCKLTISENIAYAMIKTILQLRNQLDIAWIHSDMPTSPINFEGNRLSELREKWIFVRRPSISPLNWALFTSKLKGKKSSIWRQKWGSLRENPDISELWQYFRGEAALRSVR